MRRLMAAACALLAVTAAPAAATNRGCETQRGAEIAAKAQVRLDLRELDQVEAVLRPLLREQAAVNARLKQVRLALARNAKRMRQINARLALHCNGQAGRFGAYCRRLNHELTAARAQQELNAVRQENLQRDLVQILAAVNPLEARWAAVYAEWQADNGTLVNARAAYRACVAGHTTQG